MSLQINIFKIIIFGDTNVGKSTLVEKWVTQRFNEKIKKTIGVAFNSKIVYVDNLAISLQVWDFSGEERFTFLLEMYCRGVKGGIFVFDLTNNESMLSLTKWIQKIRNYTFQDFPLFIIGNKKDLIKNDISLQNKKNFDNNIYTCSAKTGDNLDFIFQTLAERIYYNKEN